MIRNKIKYNGNDISIKFLLRNVNKFNGYQQEINNNIDNNSNNQINDVIDNETIRFKCNLDSNIIVNFYDSENNVYSNDYTSIGFDSDDLIYNKLAVRNSYWMFEFYDSINSHNQNKITNSYITKIGSYVNANDNPEFIVNNSTKQMYYLFLPKSYITDLTGNTTTLYVKISFYDALNGKLRYFYNTNLDYDLTPARMYHNCIINKDTHNWSIGDINLTEISDSMYVNKINNSLTFKNNIVQQYPTGSTYNFRENNYI